MLFNFRKKLVKALVATNCVVTDFPLINDGTFGGYIGDFCGRQWRKKVSLLVYIAANYYPCMAAASGATLMSITTMARNGRRDSLALRCLRVVK